MKILVVLKHKDKEAYRASFHDMAEADLILSPVKLKRKKCFYVLKDRDMDSLRYITSQQLQKKIEKHMLAVSKGLYPQKKDKAI